LCVFFFGGGGMLAYAERCDSFLVYYMQYAARNASPITLSSDTANISSILIKLSHFAPQLRNVQIWETFTSSKIINLFYAWFTSQLETLFSKL